MKTSYDREGRPFPYTRSATRWRKRPNDELKYLRAQVVELEGLIAGLSHSSTRPKLLKGGRGYQAEMLRKLYEESHAKKLKAALDENLRLRSKVENQFHLARALQAAIDEQVRLRVYKVSWPTTAGASDELIFALLDDEKERQYASLDRIMDASGMARISHPSFSSLQLHQTETGIAFEHNEVRMLPFPVSAVTKSLRHSLSFGSRVGPTKHCRDIRMYDGYFHAVTADDVNLPDTEPAQVTSRVLQLCVTQPERTVVTWSGYAEYKGSKFIRLLEKTWLVLESVPLERLGMIATDGRTHGTLMRVVVRLAPPETEFDLQTVADVGEMANVVVNTYRRHGQRMYQAMLEQLSGTLRKEV
ncbi:hypothetical protein PHMEG_00023281 [Phytophthora megakarya]|uniref:M96 mating-specific protein n=1 Tax=Phytophthora megakarya TaxID=4795 RepID=A0A225VI31_9STRA|nr:hypothetical protein PHMEG_00023281 [Phytophthora megakarya]